MTWIERLLSPLGVDTFLSEYWGRQSVHVAGSPDKFRDVFDVARLRAVLDGLEGAPPHVLRGMLRGPTFTILPGQVEHVLRAGGTVCLSEVHRRDSSLAKLAAEVKAELGYTGIVGVHCYWSGEGSGFGMHYDARIATTLQLAGHKRWRFGRHPAIELPASSATADAAGVVHHAGRTPAELRSWERAVAVPRDEDLSEVVLAPGDLLCLPAGVWHEACAVGGESLAVNLWFQELTFVDFLSDAIVAALGDDPVWRGAVAPAFGVHDRTMPAAVTAELADKLARFKEVIASLRADGPEIQEAWRRLVFPEPSKRE